MNWQPMLFSDLRTEVFRLHHQNDYQGAREEDQPTTERLIAQAERFREYGLEVDLQIIPGLGHDYPPDFDERLAKALAWLM